MIIVFLFLCIVIESNEILFPRRTDHIKEPESAGGKSINCELLGKKDFVAVTLEE